MKVLVLGACAWTIGHGAAMAQANAPSDLAVKKMMEYTWSQIVSVEGFTTRAGKRMTLDKTNRASIEVPLEVARDVVTAAYRSYEAELCELSDEAVMNRDSLLERARQTGKMTEQQIFYMNLLHFTVVRYTKGRLEIRLMPDGKANVSTKDVPPVKVIEPKKCDDDRRQRAKAAVEAYVKAGPPLSTASVQGEKDAKKQ